MSQHDEKMDHDLLIRIDENLKNLTQQVREMSTNVMERIVDLEKKKAELEYIRELQNDADIIHRDYERRLRVLEWSLAVAVGVVSLAEFYFRIIR